MLKKIEGPTYPASWDDHIAALIEREADGMEIAATHCLRAVGAGSKLRVWGHLESAIDALGQEFSVADLQEKYGQPYSLLGLHETARRFAAELGYCCKTLFTKNLLKIGMTCLTIGLTWFTI